MRANPSKRRATKKARAFVSKEIKKLRRRGYAQKRAVAASLSVARRKGYKIPKRKNPAGLPKHFDRYFHLSAKGALQQADFFDDLATQPGGVPGRDKRARKTAKELRRYAVHVQRANAGKPMYQGPLMHKNPAGRPLTAAHKHCIIAALQRSTGDVGFFDGARLQNDPRKAILYPSSLVAMQTAKGLPHPKGITFVVAPAGYTRDQYVREMTGVKRNPLSREEISRAAGRFERFTGHQATKVDEVPIKIPRTGYLLGPVSDISYVATRDGETSVYRHTFKARSRPSLVAASDGSSMVIAGGRYRVTADRGIVDK